MVTIRTKRGFIDITGQLDDFLRRNEFDTGILHIFCQHTYCSLIITENASADVKRDLERWSRTFVPEKEGLYEHSQEGTDDMPSHIKSILTNSDLTIPVQKGKMLLGTWQSVYLWEHRNLPTQRSLVFTFMKQ